MKVFKHFITILITITLLSCGAYSFTGGDVGDAKTFQVNFFQNNAPLIEPGLERDFRLALQNLLLNQTNLDLVKSNGDLVYEGEITTYRISPTTATSNNTAAQNRLTIAVNLRFFNTTDEEADFEQSFSFFYDFEGSTQLVGNQKTTAHTEVFDRITQDIFNASLANW